MMCIVARHACRLQAIAASEDRAAVFTEALAEVGRALGRAHGDLGQLTKRQAQTHRAIGKLDASRTTPLCVLSTN